MTCAREKVLAAFRRLSDEDQQWFREQIKRGRGRPSKSLREKVERIVETIDSGLDETARKEGITPEAVERRLYRDLADWTKANFPERGDIK